MTVGSKVVQDEESVREVWKLLKKHIVGVGARTVTSSSGKPLTIVPKRKGTKLRIITGKSKHPERECFHNACHTKKHMETRVKKGGRGHEGGLQENRKTGCEERSREVFSP